MLLDINRTPSPNEGIRCFVGICSNNLLPVGTLEFIPRTCFEDNKRQAAQDRLLPTSTFTIPSAKMLSTSERSCNTFAEVLFSYETTNVDDRWMQSAVPNQQ